LNGDDFLISCSVKTFKKFHIKYNSVKEQRRLLRKMQERVKVLS